MAEKTFISLNDKLLLNIDFAEIEYLATRTPFVGFGGWAFAGVEDCPKGYRGEKYPVVNIRISSNSDYNENYLSGTYLTDFIQVRVILNGRWDWGFLKNFSFENNYIDKRFILIEERPTISKTHTFTVEFEKSNGEIVSRISQEISWE